MRPAPDFDRLAGAYRWMEAATFGSALWRCRTAFRDRLRSRSNALVLGDGDGRFTALLLRESSRVRVDAADASRAMLDALVQRAGSEHGERLRTWQADIRSWSPPHPPYDLVVTHFFLDCLTTGEVRALAGRIGGLVTPSALWIVSEFAVPPGRFGALVARPLVWSLYRAFRLLTGLGVGSLPDHPRALAEAGFVLAGRRRRLGGLLLSEIWTPRPR